MPQSGSLSLFTSREQEYEQKAQLLKRLAYVIFCSEIDQYAKYMSDIQGNEKVYTLIFESLRISSCFRTTYHQLEAALSEHSGAGIPLFQGYFDQDEPSSCHFFVAYHY